MAARRCLYKLPRNPGSANGVRAFGRLALFDHYRTIAQRLRQEIETFLTDDPLLQADQATKLGLRTNRPRAYVVAGLAGGTGSGMFLDLAYLVRHELRQVGYMRPEVVGLFFIPPADPNAPRSSGVGNTYAALTELYHFQSRMTRYQTAFDKSEAPITDNDPPFSRIALLQLPRGSDMQKSQKVVAMAARALYHELLTPAGRLTEKSGESYRAANPAAAPVCQTFGLYRLSWPRPEVLIAATNRLAQRQLQQWTAKDGAPLREHITEWLERQWTERNLSFEAVSASFHSAARALLREEPERIFDALIDPLRTRTPSGGRFDAASACGVLEQIIKLVGKPETDSSQIISTVAKCFNARFEDLTKEAEGHLAVLAATFLEVPRFRLAGAEEAIRQFGEKLKRQVDTLEPIRVDMDKEVRSIYVRLIQAITALGASGLGRASRASRTPRKSSTCSAFTHASGFSCTFWNPRSRSFASSRATPRNTSARSITIDQRLTRSRRGWCKRPARDRHCTGRDR